MAHVKIYDLLLAAHNKADKGWKLEIHEPSIDNGHKRKYGLYKGAYKWHWFEQPFGDKGLPLLKLYDTEAQFNHSYSQINGKSEAGLWHGFKVVESVAKAAKPTQEQQRQYILEFMGEKGIKQLRWAYLQKVINRLKERAWYAMADDVLLMDLYKELQNALLKGDIDNLRVQISKLIALYNIKQNQSK